MPTYGYPDERRSSIAHISLGVRMSASDQDASGIEIWLSLLVSLVAMLGSLWLSVGMGLKACPLCFCQRTFAMGIFGILCIGLLTERQHRVVLPALVLPLAVGAAFHVSLE